MLDRISGMIDEKNLQSYRFHNHCKLLTADFNQFFFHMEYNACELIQVAVYKLKTQSGLWSQPDKFTNNQSDHVLPLDQVGHHFELLLRFTHL